MGRSISQKTHDRLVKLEAEGRRCCMDRCSQRGMWAIKCKAVDVDAAGNVLYPETANQPAKYIPYCKKHFEQEMRTIEHHGVTIDFRPAYHLKLCIVGCGEVRQWQFIELPAVRLENGDTIDREGRILATAKSFARAMRRDLEG